MKTYVIKKEREHILMEVEEHTINGFFGSEALIERVKPLFNEPITVGCGGAVIDESGRELMVDGEKTLEANDSDYIEAVLLERVRNEHGFTVLDLKDWK